MPVRSAPATGPITLGILYPTVWFGDADALAEEIKTVEAVDPRVVVTVEEYDEPHELRTERGRIGGAEAARGLAPALTDAQRAMFQRVNGVLALDLPFDVGTVAPNLAWVQGVGAGSAPLQPPGQAGAGIRPPRSAWRRPEALTRLWSAAY